METSTEALIAAAVEAVAAYDFDNGQPSSPLYRAMDAMRIALAEMESEGFDPAN